MKCVLNFLNSFKAHFSNNNNNNNYASSHTMSNLFKTVWFWVRFHQLRVLTSYKPRENWLSLHEAAIEHG